MSSWIAVDGSGNVYVTTYDDRVRVFDVNGQLLTQWPILRNLGGMAIDGSGNVYLTQFSSSSCVQVYSAGGEPLAMWGSKDSGDGQFVSPGVAVDRSGKVYVSDSGNNRVQIFSVELPQPLGVNPEFLPHCSTPAPAAPPAPPPAS